MTDQTDTTPDEVWEQETAGGAVAGELPRAALPTLPQGVTLVREAPSLRHTSGAVAQAVGAVPLALGREPRRRRILIAVRSTDATSYVVAGDSREQAGAGFGLILPAGSLVELHTAEALYLAAFGPAGVTVSWLSELDQG